MQKTIVIIVLLIIAACVAWSVISRSDVKIPDSNPPVAFLVNSKDATTEVDAGSQSVSASPVSGETDQGEKATSNTVAPKKPPPQDFGRAMPVKADASPQAASVAEALKKKDHPERLSAMIPAKPFDKASFEANPNDYLNSVEPGRCFLCAQPGKDVPALTAQTPRLSRIKQSSPATMRQLMKDQGWEETSDCRCECGWIKGLLFYVQPPGAIAGVWNWTHAMLQSVDCTWESKNGQGNLFVKISDSMAFAASVPGYTTGKWSTTKVECWKKETVHYYHGSCADKALPSTPCCYKGSGPLHCCYTTCENAASAAAAAGGP